MNTKKISQFFKNWERPFIKDIHTWPIQMKQSLFQAETFTPVFLSIIMIKIKNVHNVLSWQEFRKLAS